MRLIFKTVIWIVLVAMLLVLAGGYLGALHPLGDSLSVFRLWAAVGVCVAGIGLAVLGARLAAGAAILALAAAAPILWQVWRVPPTPEAVDLRLYTKNILGGRGDAEALIADIRASGADLVFLQEVSRLRDPIRIGLQDSHPYLHLCDFSGWSGIAILSRWSLSDPYCSPHRSIAAARVETPFGPISAVSVHLVWPYPHEQAEVLARALPDLARIDGPVVAAGDFNMVPWGASVRAIGEAAGASRIGRLHTTLRLRGLVPLQIDHVLTDGTGTTSIRPLFGVDHHGLSAVIDWPELSVP